MSSRLQPKFPIDWPIDLSTIHPPAIHSVLRPWVTLSALIFALMMWNWVLTLAVAIALVLGVTVYLAQERRLNLKWFRRSRAWKHHRSLWVALLTGIGGFGITYGMVHSWQAAAMPWMATALLLQSAGTFGVLGFLVWDRVQRHRIANRSRRQTPVAKTPKRPFQDLLGDLTSAHAVTRLIAVRQIVEWAMVPSSHFLTRELLDDEVVWSAADIRQCLQLMRKHEPELAVQQVIDEAIARMTPNAPQPQPDQWEQTYGQPLPPISSDSILAIPNLMRTRAGRKTVPHSSPVIERQSMLVGR